MALLLATSTAWPSDRTAQPLSCVYTDGCGCRVAVPNMRCPANLSTHFFHELAEGSPLKFDLGKREVLAQSTKPWNNHFGYGEGDSWTEDFQFPGGTARVDYSPGRSTCPKDAEDGCEYFDVRARVKISDSAGVRSYEGVGKCGC
ncbi:hypothetical protein LU699_12830 [Luteimonas fraxinea]|nr:hypothetical protein [Luteimonas fraxinea]MCD9125368.1 hypothetical protein [Luteimonas fraxinea]UHH09173.1 hypothetical protein LU699_12830 [Luteimonas fraxinea]